MVTMAMMHEEMHEGAGEHDKEGQGVENVLPMPIEQEGGGKRVDDEHRCFCHGKPLSEEKIVVGMLAELET
jgi:hypothetical protein